MRSLISALSTMLALTLFGLSGTALRSAEQPPASPLGTIAETPAPNSVESDLNAAVALLRQGEIEDAIDVVRPHLARESWAVDLLFDVGMTMLVSAQTMPSSEAGRREVLLDASITIFRAILAEHPGLVRVRLELARAFFLQGQDGLARRHFEHALAADLPPPVVANINRHLAEIRARKRWSAHFGIALAPDTNIGAASANETVMLDFAGQRLPFTLDDGGEKSGIGVSIWTGGEYQLPLAPSLRLRMGGNIFRSDYADSQFDRMTLRGHVGPRWLIDQRTEASLLLTARQEWRSDEPSSRGLGLRLEASRRLSPRLTGQLGMSWSEKRHDESAHLDGPVKDLSAGLSWAMTPTLQTDIRAGWSSEEPETETLRSQTLWASLGARTALPRGFNASGALTSRWTDYEGPGFPPTNVLDGSPREDVTRSIRLSGHKRDFTIRGFSPQLSVTHERRGSNAQQADYRRTWGELSFVRQF